ncbi:MAG: D-alanyl-D-alanine carboxypeptidase [Longicatena sp.]
MQNIKTTKHLHKKRLVFIILICLFLCIDIALFFGIKQYFPNAFKNEVTPPPSNINIQAQSQRKESLKSIDLNSQYALLIDLEDQSILYEKAATSKIYPASLTKVLTCIVALDFISDINETNTVTQQDLEGLYEANASVAGFEVGDTLTYEQALFALLLPSGADAANFLANHLAQSNDNFIKEMNKKAVSLGMRHTHFTNTTGLHNENHYTTLEDMKKMMDHAWKNPAFVRIITTLKYHIPPIASHPNGIDLTSTLLSYAGDLSYSKGDIIGGKSGYTLEAGCCLISIGQNDDGHLYMFISAKASGEPSIDYNHMKDAKKIYEHVATLQ